MKHRIATVASTCRQGRRITASATQAAELDAVTQTLGKRGVEWLLCSFVEMSGARNDEKLAELTPQVLAARGIECLPANLNEMHS